MSVTIRMDQDDSYAENVLKYLVKHTGNYVLDYIEEEEDNDAEGQNVDSDNENSDSDHSTTSSEDTEGDSVRNLKNPNSKKILKLMADYGDYEVDYEGHKIKIKYQPESNHMAVLNGIDRFKNLSLTCESVETKQENLDILSKFILITQGNDKPALQDKICCYIADNGQWKYLCKAPKRGLDTVFHPKRQTLLDDFNSFNLSEMDYKKHGIPYKRNYLFYGPPGTGKTSMITALASEFNANIYMVNFTSRITDADFMRLVSKLPTGSIMVLEDIDALFTERVTNDSANHSLVSFSAILNTLDGLSRKNKMISVMTTNFKDRLDEALIRPGRIDLILEFPLANESQIKEMFVSYFGEEPEALEVLVKIYRKTRSQKTSTAALQKYFFEHRSDVKLLERNLEKLTDLISQYHQTVHNLYT